jgi:hypothetical protein
MNIFIGMETSGELRRRFQAMGHFAVSVDNLPADDGPRWGRLGGHMQGDVFETFADLSVLMNFEIGVFHPTCTYHTLSAAWAFGSGPYHQKVKPGTLTGRARRMARKAAEMDIERIKRLPIDLKIIENPGGTIPTRCSLGRAHQTVQPYQFGDDASKGTCLWFFDWNDDPRPDMLLPVNPARFVPGRVVTWQGKRVERWSNQTDSGQNVLTPSADRWKDRARTYPGIADALASRFGELTDIDLALMLSEK